MGAWFYVVVYVSISLILSLLMTWKLAMSYQSWHGMAELAGKLMGLNILFWTLINEIYYYDFRNSKWFQENFEIKVNVLCHIFFVLIFDDIELWIFYQLLLKTIPPLFHILLVQLFIFYKRKITKLYYTCINQNWYWKWKIQYIWYFRFHSNCCRAA